jgi:regulation of enolase protein 1 (concanavalin A-like superfamily)
VAGSVAAPTSIICGTERGWMLASTIVFAALVATAQDNEKWEVVTSDEGLYKVEMPVCEQQSGLTPIIGAGVSGKRHEWLRHADDTIYWVLWYEGSSPIGKADEERWFKYARDEQAGFGRNGKVVSEAKIKVGTAEGRDYAYLKESAGSKTESRARAVIKGSSVYALVASPRKGDKLVTAKVDRFFDSFSFDVKPSAPKAEDKPRFDTKLLLGTWEVAKSEQMKPGTTLEFAAGGEFRSIPTDNNSSHFTGFYKIKGNEITIDPHSLTLTVKEVSPTRLVLDGFSGPTECRRKGAAVAKGMPKTGVRAGGFTFGVQPKATGGGAGRWETVASKEDGFSVQMPGRPGEENMSGGGFNHHTMRFESPNLNLVVMAVRGPTEMPKAEESKILDQLRDTAAGKFGSGLKVVSEKPVQLGSIEGREFELTLEKKNAEGTVKARGRAFASGKSAYVVLAVSGVKDKDLPPDADRFLNSFALGGSAGAAPEVTKAEPRPGPAARKAGVSKTDLNSLRTWGVEVDPDSDVEIKTSGRSLTMELPGTPHVLAPERNKMNAPRVVAPVRGDLTVAVRVDGEFRPSTESTVKGLSSRQAGGLILWKDSKNYLVFQHRTSVDDDGKMTNQAVLEELVAGAKGVTHRPAAPEGATFLRLERKRGRITAAFSADGKDWKELKPVDTTWAEGEVQVGVIAVNTSTGPHKITFEGYSLKAK